MRLLVFSALLFMVLVGLCGCGQAAESVDRENLVVPGQRLGVVALGEGQAGVRERLGAPAHTGPAAHGLPILRDVWEEAAGQYLVAYYQEDIVVQIEANGPAYATAEGVSTGSPFADIERHYAPFLTLANPYEATLTYYDAVERGISFGMMASGEGSETAQQVAVVQIHRPGHEVLLY